MKADLFRPLESFDSELLRIEKPARYLGGEVGSLPRLSNEEARGRCTMALAFPDLYEIGMSNNAVRILYNDLNQIDGFRCERVFAPAPDFEDLLKRTATPLYTLESGIALHDVDIIGFSIGYELAATSVLCMLELGGVPLFAKDRKESDPIVIAGGPAVSNPHYLGSFFDAVYIGEAEAEFYQLAADFAEMKRAGAGRSELLAQIGKTPAFWMKGKKAQRAIFNNFSGTQYQCAWPLPAFKTVQDHGTVEIMRGCPNGCRFCHAGFFNRPMRMKDPEIIRSEVHNLVTKGGYREITLASLSSGDYAGIDSLLKSLSNEWAGRGVSFQLPSLKVNSFTLPLIESLSTVRKSGLTFAIETPEDAWQLAINKDVSFEKTLAILQEARARGFRSAKFYFMIGLPVPGRGIGEAEAIIAYFDRLCAQINLSFSVNVGTFVPKPHTPFQSCAQLDEATALEVMQHIRRGLRPHRNIKLSTHSPFTSLLEGIFARGDERVGELILSAYRKGARLDAWEEHFDRELWRSVLEEADWNPIAEVLQEKENPLGPYIWNDIHSGIAPGIMAREFTKSKNLLLTSRCINKCTEPCGVCEDKTIIVQNNTQLEAIANDRMLPAGNHGRLLVQYSREDEARFSSHLSMVDTFSRALMITELPVAFSEGFNPLPRMELLPPLPLGVASLDELAAIVCTENPLDSRSPEAICSLLNSVLPKGIKVRDCRYLNSVPGVKTKSLGGFYWGSLYEIKPNGIASFAVGEFVAALSTTYLQRNGSGASFSVSSDGLVQMLLPASTRKELGLRGLLESCLGEGESMADLFVRRMECYARDERKGLQSLFLAI